MQWVNSARPKESSSSGRGYVSGTPNLRGRASRVSPLTAPLRPRHGRCNERPPEAGTMDCYMQMTSCSPQNKERTLSGRRKLGANV
ncbi:hypothetical protein Y032_0044g906 [Ancylostoma ceylanicum]|uniref:Uncharacterized protein n=1 Tax=Ancylostoma ceylanicum TaxID=53326 RepID=A0A016UD88_9BILA|nr:hypothetical protein Y032_0044g906 [Ancylostoma ceylanicum]